jgi:hypothetical protein
VSKAILILEKKSHLWLLSHRGESVQIFYVTVV